MKITPPKSGVGASNTSASGAVGGDLSGSLPGPTVVGIQSTPVCVTAPTTGQVLTFDGTDWCPATPTSAAPTTADYLVGTAQAGLSAEIVVGTAPQGELGGTWASPTVDATHSGSAHTDFIAKAIVDAKGDLIAATAADTVARVAVGTDDYVLTADSGATAGVSWRAPVGSIGEILISDTPSTPLIFADLIQNEAQNDLVYADP